MLEKRKRHENVIPIVSRYIWEEGIQEALKIKKFDGTSMEWLDMVVKCRSQIQYSHGYDIVVGKIANDNVGEYMEHYLIRTTIIPDIVKMIAKEYHISEKEALKAFYTSATGEALADDETGLYGQSILHIFGLYKQEIKELQYGR